MRALLLFAVTTFLLAVCTLGAEAKEVKVLIITGDHGHKWKETTPFLKEVLAKAGHKVDVTETPAKDLTPANLAKYDVLLLNYRNTGKCGPDTRWSGKNTKAF